MSSLIFFVVGVLVFSSPASAAACKSVPGSPFWPSAAEWQAFNSSIGGQLIKPTPPAAVCHADQPTYDASLCPTIETDWTLYQFHSGDPVSSAWNNFNNDTCIPDPTLSCSGLGYPQYVVNATSAEEVAAGVKFANSYNLRLIVKGTGHDYMGRSSAPNSLSIWTHYLTGMTFHTSFAPEGGCAGTIDTTAVTVAAGHDMIDIYAATDAYNLTVVGGESHTVGIGGYIQGGGHSVLSVSYGMAADQVLSVTAVSPSGEILVANECQNTDLFYAYRGGGGGFGVILNATIKTYPSLPATVLLLEIVMATATEDFWDMNTYLISQYPYLTQNTIMGYPYIIPMYPVAADTYYATYYASWHGVSNISQIFDPILAHINETWGSSIIAFVNTTTSYPNRYQTSLANHDTSLAGSDSVLGSRLIDEATLSGNQTALKEALKGYIGEGLTASGTVYLLGGKGVWDAQPRGGSDAVNPAWRKALGHFVTQDYWTPQNKTSKRETMKRMDERVQYLRDLIPDSGAYVNEAYLKEPNWQQAFWGDNYPKLAAIKKLRDPTDVFWCNNCVGNEGWKEVGDQLCRIECENQDQTYVW